MVKMDGFGCLYAGSFFILFGFWYFVQTCRRFGMTRQRGVQFSATHAYSCDFLWVGFKDYPWESMTKIIVAVIGLTLELICGSRDEWSSSGLEHGKFATIYFFFALSASVDLVMHYGPPAPADLDYVFSAFAFFIEWILFRFPQQDRSELEQQLYTLLEYVIFLCILAVAMEMRNRKQVIFALARSYFMLLQGTWLYQIGFVLYRPGIGISWNPRSVEDLRLTTLFFTWHCGANLLVCLVIGGIIGAIYRRKDEEVQMQSLLKPNKHGQMIISLGSFTNEDEEEDESEVEYQRKTRRP